MPVVINEFEVVVPNDQEHQAGQPQPAREPGPAPLSPQDLIDVMRHHAERMARIRAT